MWRKLLTSVFLAVFLQAAAADVLFATSVPIELGKAGNYGVLGLKNTTVKLDHATINGNVGQNLINVLGQPGGVKVQIDGTILASGWDFKLQNILNGALIAGSVEVSSATLEVEATINNANNINSFVPEPATVLLFGLGALVFIKKHGTQE